MKRICLQNPHNTTSEIALTGHRMPSVDTIKRRLRNQYQMTAHRSAVKPELYRKQRRARLRVCREQKH